MAATYSEVLRRRPAMVYPELEVVETVTMTTRMRITECFGGYSLEEGVIAIGCFFVVAGLAGSLIYFSLGIVVLNEVYGTNNVTGSTLVLSHLLGGALSVFQTVTSALLIYGCYKDRTSLLVPWVISASMSAFLALVMMIVSFSFTASFKHPAPLIDGAIQLFACGMTTYCIVVVRSYGVYLNEQRVFQKAKQQPGRLLVYYE